jgi:beta-lactamase regulating signal transducer with metallopeptidase domain
MPAADHWQTLAQIFADRMLNSMLVGVLLAVLGWGLLRTLRRQSSSTRFAVWFSIMLAIAALPFFDSAHGAGRRLTSAAHPALRLSGSWAVEIFVVWATIAAASLAKIAYGFWQLHKLRRTSSVIDVESLPLTLRRTLDEFSSRRRVVILTSKLVRVPAAIGFIRPAIILPQWAFDELSSDELNAVFLHELAHLRRWDDWTNLAQEILRAVFFFHPALWWIGRGLSLERESACDDFVLSRTSAPKAYAQCLVSVAEKNFLRRGLALAQAVAGRMHETTQRVIRILDANRSTATKVSMPAVALVAVFSCVCVIALPRAPKLVAFDASPNFLTSTPAAPLSPASFDSSITDPKAKMIPAAFHPQDLISLFSKTAAKPQILGHTPRFLPRAKNHENLTSVRNSDTDSTTTHQKNLPHLIRTAAIAETPDSVPQSVLLVIQTEQVDEYGRVWSIRVMQLTVFHPPVRAVEKGIVPKSI